MNKFIFFVVPLILLSQSVTAMDHTRSRPFATLSSFQKDELSACIAQKAFQQKHRALHQNVMEELRHKYNPTRPTTFTRFSNAQTDKLSACIAQKAFQQKEYEAQYQNQKKRLDSLVKQISLPDMIKDGLIVIGKNPDEELLTCIKEYEKKHPSYKLSCENGSIELLNLHAKSEDNADAFEQFYDENIIQKLEKDIMTKTSADLQQICQNASSFVSENPVINFIKKHGYCGLYKKLIDHEKFLLNENVLIHSELVQTLIVAKANPNQRSKLGYTPLYLAVKDNKVQATQLLLKADVNCNQGSKLGYTPLHRAVENNNIEIIRLLLARRVNCNVKDRVNGYTPLHIAASKSSYEALKLLLEAGASHCIKDLSCRTPLDYANNSATTYCERIIRNQNPPFSR